MKIFGIGLSKTGITSLSAALTVLGFRVKQFPESLDEVEFFDAATDTSVSAWFEELDRRFPDSRFIYTTRERTRWLESCRKMWLRQGVFFDASPIITRIHQSLYATSTFAEAAFSAAYDRHDSHVRTYFCERPGHLLTLNLDEENKWDMVSRFLQRPPPAVLWPRENVSAAIEALAVHLMRFSSDLTFASELTGIAPPEIKKLASVHHEALDESALRADTGWELLKFASTALKRFGNVASISQSCGLSADTVSKLLLPK